MIAIEVDKERGVYRRRYLPEAGHQSAFVLLNTRIGLTKEYVGRTLEFCLDRAAVNCEFVAGSYILGEKDLALELGFTDMGGLQSFVRSLKDDRVFQEGGVHQSVYLFDHYSVQALGLPWSDARREAYILTQIRRGFFDSRDFTQRIGDMDDTNYRLSALQIYGSASHNALVIVTTGPELLDEEEDGDLAREKREILDPPLVAVGKVLERIRTAPGVEDTLVYVCSDNLNYYKYEKVMGLEDKIVT